MASTDGLGPLGSPQPSIQTPQNPVPAGVPSAVSAAALPIIAAGEGKPEAETCCTRVKKFFATIAYPFTWLIQKIGAIFKSIADFCRELNGDTPRLKAPFKPPQPKTIDDMLKLNTELVHQFTLSATSKQNLDKVFSELFSGEAFKNVDDLKKLHACQQMIMRFYLDYEAIGKRFTSHKNVRDGFKANGTPEKLEELNNSDKLLADLYENLKKESSEVKSQWEKNLTAHQSGICDLFKQFKIGLAIQIGAVEADEKALAAAQPKPKKITLDPKQCLDLSNQYRNVFNLLNGFKWIQPDEEHKKIIALLASGFTNTVGLPNFKEGLNNVCWMNASTQALRFVTHLMTQLQIRLEEIQKQREMQEKQKVDKAVAIAKGLPVTTQQQVPAKEMQKKQKEMEQKQKVDKAESIHEDLLVAFNKLLIARDSGDQESIIQSQKGLVAIIRKSQGFCTISGFNPSGPGSQQGDADEWIVRSILDSLDFSMKATQTTSAEGAISSIVPIRMEAFRINMPSNPPVNGMEALGKQKVLSAAKSNGHLNFLELLESQVKVDTEDPLNKWQGHEKFSNTTQLSEAPAVFVTQLKRFSFEGGPSEAQKKEMMEGLTKLMKQVTKNDRATIPQRKAENVIAELLGAPKKSKITTPVDIQEVTDFSNSKVFTDEVRKSAAARNEKIQYRLKSCIIHISGSLESGHYIAIGRDDSGQWRKYDDSRVTEITVEKAMQMASESYIQFSEKVSG